MSKTTSAGDQKRKADRERLQNAPTVQTSVLNVKKDTGKLVDLRSPDDFLPWRDDPDDLRKERKAKRRKRAQKTLEQPEQE